MMGITVPHDGQWPSPEGSKAESKGRELYCSCSLYGQKSDADSMGSVRERRGSERDRWDVGGAGSVCCRLIGAKRSSSSQ